MNKSILILKFFIIEIRSIKKKLLTFFLFFQIISVRNILLRIIKKDQRPIFRNKNLNKYLILNSTCWKFDNLSNNKFILIDLTLSTHPIHTIIQCILANNFRKITGYECKAIVNEYDILTKFIANSFSVKKFEVLKYENFFKRIIYFFKSINLINKNKLLKNLVNLKKNKIEIGKAAYEFTVRNYIKDLPSKKNIHLFYYALSRSLQVLDQTKKIFSSNKIALLLMAEIQFLPNRIFFQNSLLNKIPIYSFYGAKKENQISICCFNDLKSFNQHRMKFSKKLLNFLLKKDNQRIKKKIEEFIKKEIHENQIGFGERIYLKELPKKNIIKFKNYAEFCERFDFNKKLRTILILPNVFIDNLLTHDWAIFANPIEWYLNTLKMIKNIKNVNWLIKPHPSEKIYNTNITAKKLFYKVVSSREKNINFIDEKYNIDNLDMHISSAVCFAGSAGYEYTKLGIQVYTAGDTRYSNFKLTKSPKNLKEYKFFLKNLNKPNNVSYNKKIKAGLYWFLIKSLTRLQNNLIPITLTRSNFYNEKFWELALKNLKQYKNSKINEIFYNNLYTMFKNKNRHSLDLNKIYKNKKIISIKLNDIKYNS